MIRHKIIPVTATAQNLAAAVGLSRASTESRCAFLSVQALGGNAGIVYLGGAGDALVAATNYGHRIEIPVSTVPSAPWFRENKSIAGYFNLADWQFLGTANDSIAVEWEIYP